MKSLRALMDRYEAWVLDKATSPFASLALFMYGICWIAFEAVRGKWIGWDGFITLVALEVALSTLRGRRKT